METIELTQAEELKVAKIASSTIGKLFFGGAKAIKATGFVTKKATGLTAKTLRTSADFIENVGDTANTVCSEAHDNLMKKREDYLL